MAYDRDGNFWEFNSVRAASNELGLARQNIARILNYSEKWTECPGLNGREVFMMEPGAEPLSGSPYPSPRSRPLVGGINYDLLPFKALVGIDSNYTVRFIWDNALIAAGACGIQYTFLKKYINNR